MVSCHHRHSSMERQPGYRCQGQQLLRRFLRVPGRGAEVDDASGSPHPMPIDQRAVIGIESQNDAIILIRPREHHLISHTGHLFYDRDDIVIGLPESPHAREWNILVRQKPHHSPLYRGPRL